MDTNHLTLNLKTDGRDFLRGLTLMEEGYGEVYSEKGQENIVD